jgi:glucose-6-phosphate 1-dehydrogenase
VKTPEDHLVLLFGATGDLAKRKLLPGLFRLAQAGLLPARYRIVGAALDDLDDDAFRTLAREAVDEFGGGAEPEAWTRFARNLLYADARDRSALTAATGTAELELGGTPRRLHYLSLPPVAFGDVVETLVEAGLVPRSRVVIEKPFGTDLPTARALNGLLHEAFDESQIFRIDHFLGKETVQNILALRFANGVFETVWNRHHIEHVQIDVPETLSIGSRGYFYEGTGAFRDMLVTHLLQVLGFVAMEPPTSFAAKALVDETVKVFEAMTPLRPEDVVRGQYRGYRETPGVAADSDTETFVAARVHIDNWRWAGVPFYLRTGKRLAESKHLLTVAYAQPPRRMFPLDCHHVAESFGSDHLTFELGDPGSISTSFLAKVPGPTMQLGEAHMDFSYAGAFGGPEQALEPYERLIHDVMIGDRMLFTTAAGIERLWEVSAPVLENPPALESYRPGSWGPNAMEHLIAPRRWHLPGKHV